VITQKYVPHLDAHTAVATADKMYNRDAKLTPFSCKTVTYHSH